VEVILQLELGARIVLSRQEIHNQGLLDREHGIVGDVAVSAVEDLRREALIARSCDLRNLSVLPLEQSNPLWRSPALLG
jgi:hypothetical protein